MVSQFCVISSLTSNNKDSLVASEISSAFNFHWHSLKAVRHSIGILSLAVLMFIYKNGIDSYTLIFIILKIHNNTYFTEIL